MWCCVSPAVSESPLKRTAVCSNPHQPTSWGELPSAVIARSLACLPFDDRCVAACTCWSWAQIVASAAAHEQSEPGELQAPGMCRWAASRLQPCEVDAVHDGLQVKLQQCRAISYANSAAVWMCAAGSKTLQQLQGLTRLHLLDIRCDVEGRHLTAPAADQAAISLKHLRKLRVLNVGMSTPLVDFAQLPSSLQCLHLNLASGYSVGQLQGTCAALAAAAQQLPNLQHISVGMELDALLGNSQGAVLAPLSALTQLTSVALTDYQYMHPDSPAHEGYTVVPPVLQQLKGLCQVQLHMSSGQNAQLAAAAAIPDVRLVLTLARHEQVQFNRLPPSLISLTGLTSLSILMAEFAHEPDSDLFVFDASPLALCHQLRSLLLELHGSKCSQHDLRGLGQLQGLQELVVLFKCPDVHEARPDMASTCGSNGSAGLAGDQPGSVEGSAGSGSGFGSWLSRTTAALRRPGAKGLAKLLHKSWVGAAVGGEQDISHHGQQQGPAEGLKGAAGAGGSAAVRGVSGSSCDADGMRLLCEEWVLQLLDTALDQLRPEFALSVPRVTGRLLLATTSRLLLRQPELVAAAGEPLLLASHVQLDCDSSGDCWGGECFLQHMTPGALRGWVSRNWQPLGVELLEAARYPQLGSYPGCRQRIDDKLLVVARAGVSGQDVVQAVMSVVEERCMAYFS